MDEDKIKEKLLQLWTKDIPPLPIRPANSDRIIAVRNIIRRKYKLSLIQAEFITCALFGFMGPFEVRDACDASSSDEIEASDEQCTHSEIIKRRREQTETLVTLLDITRREAKEVVSRIRPTASNWKPSLRKTKWHGQLTATVE